MIKQSECMACIGFDCEHTCTGYADMIQMREAMLECSSCRRKDKRIRELEAQHKEAQHLIEKWKATQGVIASECAWELQAVLVRKS